jgi:hypothetical protein
MKMSMRDPICFLTDIDTYRPAEPDDFGIWVDFAVQSEAGDGEDCFRILVCSPKWIAEEYGREGGVFGKDKLVILNYDPALIRRMLNEYIEDSIDDSSWYIAKQLSRVASRAFEAYEEATPAPGYGYGKRSRPPRDML